MTFDDRESLAAIAEKARQMTIDWPTLIESLVLSDLFQKR